MLNSVLPPNSASSFFQQSIHLSLQAPLLFKSTSNSKHTATNLCVLLIVDVAVGAVVANPVRPKASNNFQKIQSSSRSYSVCTLPTGRLTDLSNCEH